MTSAALYALTGVALFGIGFYAVVVQANRLRKVLAVNVMGNGVFMVLVALAYRTPNAPPDPVPHAMVLTGIVVAVSATAVALALIRQTDREPSNANSAQDREGTQS